VVESGGLENRYRGNSIESSNLSFSANSNTGLNCYPSQLESRVPRRGGSFSAENYPVNPGFFISIHFNFMAQLKQSELIAPCGMNCGICYAFLREKNRCAGCRDDQYLKPASRFRCKIKNCDFYSDEKKNFCYQCKDFPSKNLKHLDNRYKLKYNMSMIENLISIKTGGIRKFIKSEEVRWMCSECGGTVCVHKKKCMECSN
jgi:hypothetical protein